MKTKTFPDAYLREARMFADAVTKGKDQHHKWNRNGSGGGAATGKEMSGLVVVPPHLRR